MEPAKNKKTTAEENPVQQARTDAEEDIASDPDFQNDPASDDLDEGELASLDNSNDGEV